MGKMTIKEQMLEFVAGDASPQDPYIEQARGKVDMSTYAFEYAVKIAEANQSGETLDVIQEAADAGMPTESDQACELGCTAVKKGLEGLYDVILSTAKKIKDNTAKDIKTLRSVGKSLGVEGNVDGSNFMSSFATPFSAVVFDKKGGSGVFKSKIEMKEGATFLKGSAADKIGKNYVKGMTSFLHAYGFDISDVFNDDIISKTYEKSYAKKGGSESFAAMADALDDGSSLITMEALSKDKHYTELCKTDDIESLCVNLYVIYVISEAVVSTLGGSGAKKTAVANIEQLCKNDCENEKMTKAVKNIGENLRTYSDNVSGMCDNITKGFTDSVYSLITAIKD